MISCAIGWVHKKLSYSFYTLTSNWVGSSELISSMTVLTKLDKLEQQKWVKPIKYCKLLQYLWQSKIQKPVHSQLYRNLLNFAILLLWEAELKLQKFWWHRHMIPFGGHPWTAEIKATFWGMLKCSHEFGSVVVGERCSRAIFCSALMKTEMSRSM